MPQDRDARAMSRAESADDHRAPLPGVPAPAVWLGFSGLIPFAAGAAAVVALGGEAGGEAGGLAADLLAGYGAVILAFMGGCRWGFASAGLGRGAIPGGARGARQEWLRYAVSVVPALFAWPVLWLADPLRMGLLAVGFVALLGGDVLLTEKGGAPDWWPRLRRPLSWGAAGCLALAAALGG